MKELLINHQALPGLAKASSMRHRTLSGVLLKLTLTLLALFSLPSIAWGEEYTYYNITITGTQVTSDNAEDIFADDSALKGKVRFDVLTNTLSMNGATISGSIESGLESLTIELSGENTLLGAITISAGTTETTANLAFAGEGTLSISNASGGSVISGFSNVDFGNYNLASSALGVNYANSTLSDYNGNAVPNVELTTTSVYPIWIYQAEAPTSYKQVTAENMADILGDNTLTFDGSQTLTLNGFSIDGPEISPIIIGSGLNELSISLSGENSIGYGIHFISYNSDAETHSEKLTFTTNESEPGSVTGYEITNLGSNLITCDNGLKRFYNTKNETEEISVNWPRIVIGNSDGTETYIVSSNTDVFKDGTVAFDATTNTLTLTGASLSDALIRSNLEHLNISLSGENTLGSLFAETEAETNTIAFSGNGNLTLQVYENATFTYSDGLGLKNSEEQWMIAPLEAPAFSSNYNYETNHWNLMMTSDFKNASITYSITYASSKNKNVEGTYKGNPIELMGPATITAKVTTGESNEGPTATAYYFGAEANPMKFVFGDAFKAPTIVPTVEDINIANYDYLPQFIASSEDGTKAFTGLGSEMAFARLGKPDAFSSFVLNDTISFKIEVLPPAPQIVYDETKTYLNTDLIEITLDETSTAPEGTPYTIYYTWEENSETGIAYPEGGILAQSGTLTAWISVTDGKNTFTGEKVSQTFAVKKDIAAAYVLTPENATYTAQTIVPELMVKESGDAETTLTVGTDYSLTYQIPGNEDGTPTTVEEIKDAGTYIITITGAGEYAGSKIVTESFIVSQADLANAVIEDIDDREYTGYEIRPEITVKLGDAVIDATEYSVTYTNNIELSGETEAEKATVTITSTNKNFIENSTASTFFSIVQANTTITAENTSTTYNTQPQAYTGAKADDGTIGITYYSSEEDRSEGINGTEVAPTNAGTYYIRATQTDNHYVSEPADATYTINPATITKASLDKQVLIYNGEEQTTEVVEVDAGSVLVDPTYYTVSGNSGTEAGVYTVTVTAVVAEGLTNNFTGSTTTTFEIKNRSITESLIGFAEGQTTATYYNQNEDFDLPEGIVAYIITGVNGTNVTTQRLSYIPKDTPVLVEKTASSETVAEVADGNMLEGTTGETQVGALSGNVYLLYKNEFVKATSGVIPAGRGFLLLSNAIAPAGTRGLGIEHGEGYGEDTTGIRQATAEEATSGSEAWYTIDGLRVDGKPAKTGLYIKNGKKIVVK